VSVRYAYEYSVIRVVPRPEREEFVNVGVILFCDACNFLGARVDLDEKRVSALWPDIELATLKDHLDGFCRVCVGGASAGPIGHLSLRERFRWLVAPRSTLLQTSAPHAGLTEDPEVSLERLLDQLVRTGRPPG
jgi:Protein of unknown function (DUF3037)